LFKLHCNYGDLRLRHGNAQEEEGYPMSVSLNAITMIRPHQQYADCCLAQKSYSHNVRVSAARVRTRIRHYSSFVTKKLYTTLPTLKSSSTQVGSGHAHNAPCGHVTTLCVARDGDRCDLRCTDLT